MKMADNKNEFTDRERELMYLAWQCFDAEPKVDYKKLAGLAGMTNAGSASNAWAKIKKKIQAHAGNAGTASGGASPVKNGNGGDADDGETPKPTPKKRGKKAAADGESPAKKAKGGKRGQKGAAADADEDDEEAQSSPVKAEPEEDGDFE